MHRFQKRFECILYICLVAVAFFGASTGVSAATNTSGGGEKGLPAGILIGDENGIHVDSNGFHFIDAKGKQPGDVIHKTLTLQNISQNNAAPESNAPFHLSLTVEPLSHKGPVDLFEKVIMTLSLNGKTVYQGPSNGKGSQNIVEKALDLGAFHLGDRKTLAITLTVDPTMQLSEEKSEADFKWRFYAYRAKEEAGPKTGILETYGLFLPVGCVLLLCAILIPLKKRRDARQRRTTCEPE